jgi:RNA-directed DNA polymerase
MTERDADSMAEKPETHAEGSGRNPRGTEVGASKVTARREDSSPEEEQLMEAVVERENMLAALQRVMSNRGAAGVDGMTVEELKAHLREEWKRIKEELLTDEYRPAAVLKVEIPKADGKGVRKLGIPTVRDRLIQQGLHQILSPIFDGGFSESSYGFRPGRSAHDAVRQARA